MTTVAITGVGGLIGRRLAGVLDAEQAVERIVGIDVREHVEVVSPKLEYRRVDVRDHELGSAIDGADTVVHLAFRHDPAGDADAMRSVNVGGTRNVAEAAAAAGAGKLVYVSSGTVYGAHPDNDLPLTEDSPLRPNPGYVYAAHKLEIERWLESWAEEHPRTTVTVFRPSIVAGPGVQNFVSRQIEAPRFVAVKGHRPPLQFAHVDDVVAALVAAVTGELPGVYNVTAEGWLSFDETVAISGVRVLEIPEELALALTARRSRWRLVDYPPGAVAYVMHPWVLSVDRLLETGWRPRHSNRDALVAMVEEHTRYLTVAGIRTTRQRLRVLAAGVAGAATALVWLRLLRRRGAAR